MQGTHEHVDSLDDKGSVASFDDMVEALGHIIHKISCEVVLMSELNNAVPFQSYLFSVYHVFMFFFSKVLVMKRKKTNKICLFILYFCGKSRPLLL